MTCATLMVLLACLGPTADVSLVEGFAEPFRKIDLAPAEPGVISELLVREGDRVEKGQVVAALDRDVLTISRDIAAANVEAQGKLHAAQAERELRQTRLTKLRELRERGHASQEELNRAQTELTVAEARIRELEEQRSIDALEIKRAEALIERRLIRSPIQGVVTRVHREEKEFVTAMSPMVVSVVQLHPLRVSLNLPSSAALSMKPNMELRLSVPEMDRTVVGRVEMVSPVIDAESGTVRVKFLVDNHDGTLTSGMRCTLPLDSTELARTR